MNANDARPTIGVARKNVVGRLHHAVATGKLRGVKRDIGTLEHAVDRVLWPPPSYAKTAGDIKCAVRTFEFQAFHFRSQPVGRAHGALNRLALQHESKLFSTQATYDGGFASSSRRHGAQD